MDQLHGEAFYLFYEVVDRGGYITEEEPVYEISMKAAIVRFANQQESEASFRIATSVNLDNSYLMK